jgi:phage terminase small subunit
MGGIKYKDREIKQKKGTLRSNRKNPVLMKGKKVKTLAVPGWLGPIATDRWKWAIKILGKRKTLCEEDAPMLELFCVLYEQIRTATAKGDELKPSLVSQLRLLGESFGLSPTGRARVQMPEPEPEPEPLDPNSWEAYVNRKRPE